MKTVTLSMLLVLIAGICNAQFENFDKFKIETYSTKSKVGALPNTAKFLDDVEFQKIQKQFEKKKVKKLGETIVGPDNLGKEYICTSAKGDMSDKICFRIFDVDKEKKIVKLEFSIFNAQAGKNGKINEFYYQVKKEYNYVLTLNSNKRNSYTFLISPGTSSELAEK